MRILSLSIGLFLSSITAWSQDYTSYLLGNTADVVAVPEGGICLMGGASENDSAIAWFLNRTDGGDVLILRTSGTDGYNSYFYNDFNITLNSVETIVCHNANATNDTYLHHAIQKADAIWFAGGDQWDYVSFWRNTAVDSLINDGIQNRNIVIGGTSAGMAIQGGVYFSAQNGTINTSQALLDPYNTKATVDSTSFIKNDYLENVITDTHYDNPDRLGRHIAFMARMMTDYAMNPKGIASEEYTAVCIDENGMARVFGDYPSYQDFAYFLVPNCELTDYSPETCAAGQSLVWDRNGQALKVYKVPGTMDGSNTFDLNNWNSGTGGIWQDIGVNNTTITTNNGVTAPNCSLGFETFNEMIQLYPNPVVDVLYLEGEINSKKIQIIDNSGKVVLSKLDNSNRIDVSRLDAGIYYISIISEEGIHSRAFFKMN